MSFSFLEETAFQYWAQLDCPTSLSLTIMARAGMWAEVLAFKVDPQNFVCPYEFAKAASACAFLKKNPFIKGSSREERKKRALASWRDGEASCYRANERLAPYLIHPFEDSQLAEFLRQARGILLNMLGPCPDDVDSTIAYEGNVLTRVPSKKQSLNDLARFGPGTTLSSEVRNPTAADKYHERLSLTHNARFYLWNLAGTKWLDLQLDRAQNSSQTLWETVLWSRGNRFASVPKSALTDRGIAIECTLNTYFQLAIGTAMRRNLKRSTGWDLNTCADVHREMARRASIDGSFSTIDLSNASDSLCKNLVRVLLRDTPWLERMEDLRSTHTFFEGRWHLLEKFSSMGNGFTFELETCIFACLVAAVIREEGGLGLLGYDVFVFGDDIILPTNHTRSVIAMLAWAGFKVNEDKSFITGPFRESCGGDFFNGYPVRGFYLKDQITYGTQAIYKAHNGTRISLQNCGINTPWFCDWLRRRFLPTPLRHIGGSTRLGDVCLHGVPEKVKWKHGIRWVTTVRWYEPILLGWKYWPQTVRLACRLTGYGDTAGIFSRGSSPAEGFRAVSDS